MRLRRVTARMVSGVKRPGVSADMELSYVKALKILNRLEENLGRKVVIRTRGGAARGGAEITPFAERYIEEYDRFLSALNAHAEKSFRRRRLLSRS